MTTEVEVKNHTKRKVTDGNLVTSKDQKGSEDRVREFHGIRKPKTVDEFRENLVKYFVTVGPESNPQIYTSGVRGHGGYSSWVPVNELDYFGDIYRLTKSGFSSPMGVDPWSRVPMVTPKIQLVGSINEWYSSHPLRVLEGPGFFLNENNFKVEGTWDYEDEDDWKYNDTPCWVKLDNKIYRDFWVITLGEFSGYNEVTNV